ncbi:hypothetical protein L916_17309 [Phytophthora nicotianae]|uniref:Uncharacterized protein n=1 Tax=Phytophthora nicotianae TaxID=4792 RepID=W2I5Y0_PHYNI|nr:hypothetical protein L916_17309 [Phytophthora nicotianae]
MVAVARDCNSLLHNSNTTSAATTIVLAIGKEVTVTTGLAGIPQVELVTVTPQKRELVKMFFYNFVRGMDSYENKDGLASGFGALARRFDWSGIGSEILESLGDTVDPMSMDMGMHM